MIATVKINSGRGRPRRRRQGALGGALETVPLRAGRPYQHPQGRRLSRWLPGLAAFECEDAADQRGASGARRVAAIVGRAAGAALEPRALAPPLSTRFCGGGGARARVRRLRPSRRTANVIPFSGLRARGRAGPAYHRAFFPGMPVPIQETSTSCWWRRPGGVRCSARPGLRAQPPIRTAFDWVLCGWCGGLPSAGRTPHLLAVGPADGERHAAAASRRRGEPGAPLPALVSPAFALDPHGRAQQAQSPRSAGRRWCARG